MNKKGGIYSIIMISFILFIAGMTIANFLKDPIDHARTDLNCATPSSISDGTKLMCLTVDFTMIYFIILIVSIAGGAILDKVLI